MKNSEKFIFVVVIIVAAFFSRTLYPSIAVPPQQALINQSETAIAQSTPSLLVLPQTSSINSANGVGQPAQTTSSSTTTVSSSFSRIGYTKIPNFSNEAYMIADLTTGAVLSGSNIDYRWPTASLTKLMTATVVFDTIATSTEITITPEIFAADPDETTLVIGNTYTVEDLLHLMLMPSSNVAAEAMADYVGRAKFMQEMNTRAQEWGMRNTYFDDPSGISAANESSANDLLVLAQHVYTNYPNILAITRTHQYTITEIASTKATTITSINDYAGEPDFIGGKTGHTDQAGGNLLSIFNYNGHPVLVIVLNTVDRFGDTTKLYTWFRTNFI